MVRNFVDDFAARRVDWAENGSLSCEKYVAAVGGQNRLIEDIDAGWREFATCRSGIYVRDDNFSFVKRFPVDRVNKRLAVRGQGAARSFPFATIQGNFAAHVLI